MRAARVNVDPTNLADQFRQQFLGAFDPAPDVAEERERRATSAAAMIIPRSIPRPPPDSDPDAVG